MQRRCQYAQLLPNQQLFQPFNQAVQHRKHRANQLFRNELRLTDPKPRKISTESADIAQSTDTNGLSAETDNETLQPDTITPTERLNNRRTTRQNRNQHSMRNWSAKFVDTRDTPQKIADIAYQLHRHMEVYPTTDRPHRKTEFSAETSQGPKAATTQRMK